MTVPADWSYHTVPQPGCRGRRVFWPRGKMVGGSGAMNAMIYIRGLPSDFDNWENLNCPGWSWKDVLPDFITSENNIQHGNSPLHGSNGLLHVESPTFSHEYESKWIAAGIASGYPANDDFNGESQEGFGFFQLTIKGGMRSGTNRAFLEPAIKRSNLTLKKGVLITKVLIKNNRCTGVEFLENGVSHKVHAQDEVILSAGAIGTPQILMLSGLGKADELAAVGIKAKLDIPEIGKNLQDHINIPISFYSKTDTGVGAWDEEFLRKSFEEWEQHRTGPRATTWAAAGAHIRSRPDTEPDLQLYGAVSPHRDYGRFLSSRSGMTLHTVLQRPKSRGEIMLASADPIAHPLIDPKYFSSDSSGNDLATLVEGIKIQRRIASEHPLSEVLDGEMQPSSDCQTDPEIMEYVRGHCTTLYHPAGTCRMGKDVGAVVDSDTFALKGIDGLYVADASLLPEMISGNINATTILIAERCAQALS